MPQDIHDFLKRNRKLARRRHRAEWIKEHIFDILNLVIAVAALIISIFGLYLPKSEQTSQVQAEPETAYSDENNVQD